MEEWMILQQPKLLLLYGLALFLAWYGRESERPGMTMLSAVLAIAATAFLLILGGSLWEGAAWLTLFFLWNRERAV